MIESVPLIQNPNDAQQINASIIAMKKASRELDEKIVKLNSLNSELDKKIALLDSGLNKEIEDRKEAINSLDVPSVGGSGKYISAISETDGKISATAGDITSSVSSGNSQPVTSGGVADAIGKVIYDGTITDCNNAWQKGKTVTYVVAGISNVPSTETGWYILSQCNPSVWSSNNYVTQIATPSDNKNINVVYTRHAYLSGSNMVWTPWTRLIKDTDVGNLKFFYKNYGQVSISAGVTIYDLPTELSGKNIVMAFGAIGSYLMPRPHLNNAGQYAQTWGLGVSLTGGKLNILTPDSWSGILQIVFIYN